MSPICEPLYKPHKWSFSSVKTGHQDGYSLMLGFNTSLWSEGAHASAVVEFPLDQTCEASGLTQYPLTLGCIYVWWNSSNVAALKYQETLHHLLFIPLPCPHPAHNFSSCLSIRWLVHHCLLCNNISLFQTSFSSCWDWWQRWHQTVYLSVYPLFSLNRLPSLSASLCLEEWTGEWEWWGGWLGTMLITQRSVAVLWWQACHWATGKHSQRELCNDVSGRQWALIWLSPVNLCLVP